MKTTESAELLPLAQRLAVHLPGGDRRWVADFERDYEGRAAAYVVKLADRQTPGFGIRLSGWGGVSARAAFFLRGEPRTTRYANERAKLKAAGFNPNRHPAAIAADIARRVVPHIAKLAELAASEADAKQRQAVRHSELNAILSRALGTSPSSASVGERIRLSAMLGDPDDWTGPRLSADAEVSENGAEFLTLEIRNYPAALAAELVNHARRLLAAAPSA